MRKRLRARGHLAKYDFSDILGESEKIKDAIEKAKRFGKVDATVLIYGETGTGKEFFAHAIHNVSSRKNGPFIAVNCAAMPESLLESELFGYAEGAFTGAKKGGKRGLFEAADGGTIFLDEISEMSDKLQTRLLRVLQEYEIMRLGDNRVIRIDVRVIAATNRNLHKMVAEKLFRADLFYRINVLTLVIPSLRERREDIPVLVDHFLHLFNRKFGKNIKGVERRGMELLAAHDWPGNIRELKNIMERLVILSDGEYIPAELVAESLYTSSEWRPTEPVRQGQPDVTPGQRRISRLEEEAIREALIAAKGNKKKAAALLGISRTTLWRRLKKLQSGEHR